MCNSGVWGDYGGNDRVILDAFQSQFLAYISRLRPLVNPLSSAKRASSRVRKLQHDFPGMRCFRLEKPSFPSPDMPTGGNRRSLTYAFPAMTAAKNIGPPFQLLDFVTPQYFRDASAVAGNSGSNSPMTLLLLSLSKTGVKWAGPARHQSEPFALADFFSPLFSPSASLA